ncbi:MAG: ABC-F family ATP-binding cassette domain-containing protein, partial [Pseudomonadales bacterium]|nr:ABC-F family ATP-binding cassette domain-containing protein [Pseudomonadales bacterium]
MPGTDTALFYIEDFFIRPGDRVALLGHNGVGKTTLINEIMNRYENDRDGESIKFNPQCEIGYYDQELETLSPNRTMVEILRDSCHGADSDHKSALIKAGFPYTDIDKQVRVLSGGEKARLMFLIMKLNRPNFLILDEPTNHIDIEGKEELEAQLLESDATVLITSHDRRFVDNIADRHVLIHDGVMREIHDPARFYELDRQVTGNASRPTSTDKPAEASEPADEEEMLQRIVELERVLAEDLARKPKF